MRKKYSNGHSLSSKYSISVKVKVKVKVCLFSVVWENKQIRIQGSRTPNEIIRPKQRRILVVQKRLHNSSDLPIMKIQLIWSKTLRFEIDQGYECTFTHPDPFLLTANVLHCISNMKYWNGLNNSLSNYSRYIL